MAKAKEFQRTKQRAAAVIALLNERGPMTREEIEAVLRQPGEPSFAYLMTKLAKRRKVSKMWSHDFQGAPRWYVPTLPPRPPKPADVGPLPALARPTMTGGTVVNTAAANGHSPELASILREKIHKSNTPATFSEWLEIARREGIEL